MADAAAVRAALRENGIDVPTKGKLSAEHWAEYERLTGGEASDGNQQGYPAGESPDDMGVTAADFGPDEPDEPVRAEVVPTRPRARAKSRRPLMDRLRGTPPPKSGGRGKAKRAVHKRVPLDRLGSRFWEIGGRIISQVDVPLGRMLVWQSDSAGLMVEKMAKDTIVDRLAQPLARAEERAELGFALFGPGFCVAALRMAEGLPDQQRAMRQAIILPVLREAVVINLQIAGELAEERIKDGIDLAPFYAKADEVLASVFAAVPQPAPEPEMASA